MEINNQLFLNEKKLESLEKLLAILPKKHTTFNEHLSEIVIQPVLTHQNKTHPSILGVYRTNEKSLSLFSDTLSEQNILSFCNNFDFTFLFLIGQSLWMQEDVKIFWGKHFYPQFDKGSGTSLLVKLIDKNRLLEQIKYQHKKITLNPSQVSLDESFALLYACYTLNPQSIVDYPIAWSFFHDILFQ